MISIVPAFKITKGMRLLEPPTAPSLSLEELLFLHHITSPSSTRLLLTHVHFQNYRYHQCQRTFRLKKEFFFSEICSKPVYKLFPFYHRKVMDDSTIGFESVRMILVAEAHSKVFQLIPSVFGPNGF